MRFFTLLLFAGLACVQVERRPEADEPIRCEELPSEHTPLASYLIDEFPPPESFSIHPDFPSEIRSSSLRRVDFTITNRSVEAVKFPGYGPGGILGNLQHHVAGAWEFDWGGSMHCGTGLGTHVLKPGQSASIYVLRNTAFDARGTATLVGCSTGIKYLVATPEVPRHVCTEDCP